MNYYFFFFIIIIIFGVIVLKSPIWITKMTSPNVSVPSYIQDLALLPSPPSLIRPLYK